MLLAVIAVVGCGGDDAAETTGGTVPLFGGTVPDGGPAIDLSPSSDRGTGRDVVVIGDSITVASAPQIEAAAEELDVDVTVLAEVGRRITVGRQPAAGTDVLAEVLAEGDPDLVVVALGTNDIGKYTTIAEYAGQIDELVGMLPEDQPLVWINTYLANTPGRLGDVQRRTARDAHRPRHGDDRAVVVDRPARRDAQRRHPPQ